MYRYFLTRLLLVLIIAGFFSVSITTLLIKDTTYKTEIFGTAGAQVTYSQPDIMTGTIEIDIEMRFMFGSGGGTIKASIEGNAASELRRRIDQQNYLYTATAVNRNNSKVDGDVTEGITEIGAFAELIEDRLELESITNFYDIRTKNSYNGIFAGIDISRKGGSEGVDITGVNGLKDSPISSTDKITFNIKFGGSFAENQDRPELSNGAIIFYALFGYEPDEYSLWNETKPDIRCHESINSIIVGMGSYSGANKENGKLTKYRIPGGEVVTFTQSYDIAGDSRVGYLEYDPSNIFQSSLVLAIFGLICSIIILLLPRSFYKSSGAVKKVKWIHFMAIGFFLIILLLYFLGINGLSIWIGAPLFIVITIACSYKFYSKAAGITTKTPELEQNKWHKIALKYFDADNLPKALESMEHALEQDMQNEVLWNDKGHILRKMGRYQDALKCFNLALKINPEYDNALRNKQLTMEDLKGDRDEI